jgi:hypothetical protein
MKICSKCNAPKPKSQFYKNKLSKDGLYSWCNTCAKEYRKTYHYQNKEICNQKNKEWRIKNKDKKKKSNKEWLSKNKEHRRKYKQQYRKENKEQINAYKREQRRKYMQDPEKRIQEAVRARLRKAIRLKNTTQKSRDLVGCSIEFLKQYLESLFAPGMSWDNYGQWHIDHIQPVCKFCLIDEEQLKKCFHYSNLQPLWAEDNIKKGSKLQD